MMTAAKHLEPRVEVPPATWTVPGQDKPVAEASVHWDPVWTVTDAQA